MRLRYATAMPDAPRPSPVVFAVLHPTDVSSLAPRLVALIK